MLANHLRTSWVTSRARLRMFRWSNIESQHRLSPRYRLSDCITEALSIPPLLAFWTNHVWTCKFQLVRLGCWALILSACTYRATPMPNWRSETRKLAIFLRRRITSRDGIFIVLVGASAAGCTSPPQYSAKRAHTFRLTLVLPRFSYPLERAL